MWQACWAAQAEVWWLLWQVVSDLGTADIDARLEELLIDGILYAFQEQVSDDANVMLNGFGTVVNSLKMRAKPYLPQICGTIKWRLNNKAAKIRQQAADLIARIAIVMKVGKKALIPSWLQIDYVKSLQACIAAALLASSMAHANSGCCPHVLRLLLCSAGSQQL